MLIRDIIQPMITMRVKMKLKFPLLAMIKGNDDGRKGPMDMLCRNPTHTIKKRKKEKK